MTERCQNGKPVRSFHGMTYEETWPELDRRYWHPCTKIWRQPSCRGQVGAVPLNARFGICQWRHRWETPHPHLCG